jgi:V8-like Glu-specific endopeptidase
MKLKNCLFLLLILILTVPNLWGNEFDYKSYGVVIKSTNGVGSGFILKGGYVITNAHVVNSNTELIISTVNKDYYSNQLYYFNQYVDLAIIKVENLPKDIGLNLFDYRNGEIGDTLNAQILRTVTYGDVETFKTDPITIKKYSSGSSFSNRVYLNQYYSEYKFSYGNSGSPILVNDEVIGVVVGALHTQENPYIKGTIISTEYLQYIINNIRNFESFSVNKIPAETKIYSPVGEVVGISDLTTLDYINYSGYVDLNVEGLSIHLPIKNNLTHGLLKINRGKQSLIELNFNTGKQNGEIEIFSSLNYVRIKGMFENGLPIGNWQIFNGYHEPIERILYEKLTLFHLYEDLVNEISTSYIFTYKKDGFNFIPSKFRIFFLAEIKQILQAKKLMDNWEMVFSLPPCFYKEKLDAIAQSALNNSRN